MLTPPTVDNVVGTGTAPSPGVTLTPSVYPADLHRRGVRHARSLAPARTGAFTDDAYSRRSRCISATGGPLHARVRAEPRRSRVGRQPRRPRRLGRSTCPRARRSPPRRSTARSVTPVGRLSERETAPRAPFRFASGAADRSASRSARSHARDHVGVRDVGANQRAARLGQQHEAHRAALDLLVATHQLEPALGGNRRRRGRQPCCRNETR